jgi:hypothetical protein
MGTRHDSKLPLFSKIEMHAANAALRVVAAPAHLAVVSKIYSNRWHPLYVNSRIDQRTIVTNGRSHHRGSDVAVCCQIGPSMRITQCHAHGQVPGQPIVKPERHSTSGKVVPLGVGVTAYIDGVPGTADPHPPPVLRRRRHYALAGFHDCLAIFPLNDCLGTIRNI